MERLTKEGKFCDVIECELTPGGSFCERGTCTERRLWERLSSIEDILGDDYDLDRLRVIINQRMSMRDEVAKRFEITKDIPLDRLRELVEADRDERCVVLPCKVGDKVKIDANTWGNVWNYKTIEHGKFLVGEIISIIKTKKQTLIKIKAEHNVEWKRPTKRYPVSAIGLTVFVKSKSAVAALKGEKDGE